MAAVTRNGFFATPFAEDDMDYVKTDPDDDGALDTVVTNSGIHTASGGTTSTATFAGTPFSANVFRGAQLVALSGNNSRASPQIPRVGNVGDNANNALSGVWDTHLLAVYGSAFASGDLLELGCSGARLRNGNAFEVDLEFNVTGGSGYTATVDLLRWRKFARNSAGNVGNWRLVGQATGVAEADRRIFPGLRIGEEYRLRIHTLSLGGGTLVSLIARQRAIWEYAR